MYQCGHRYHHHHHHISVPRSCSPPAQARSNDRTPLQSSLVTHLPETTQLRPPHLKHRVHSILSHSLHPIQTLHWIPPLSHFSIQPWLLLFLLRSQVFKIRSPKRCCLNLRPQKTHRPEILFALLWSPHLPQNNLRFQRIAQWCHLPCHPQEEVLLQEQKVGISFYPNSIWRRKLVWKARIGNGKCGF